jgi:hypothetical protein
MSAPITKCNWKCCLRCSHPSEEDYVYIDKDFKMSVLDKATSFSEKMIKETHESIFKYVQLKLRKFPGKDIEAFHLIRDGLHIDLNNRYDLITISHFLRIKYIVSEISNLNSQQINFKLGNREIIQVLSNRDRAPSPTPQMTIKK